MDKAKVFTLHDQGIGVMENASQPKIGRSTVYKDLVSEIAYRTFSFPWALIPVLYNGLTADQIQQATCKYTISIAVEISNTPKTKLGNRVSKDALMEA